MSTPTGWDLVTAAQRGDRDAFGELYTRYAAGVAGFLGNRLRDRDTVEDLTSETFTRALRRIDSVSDQGRDVGAWFTTIARNLLADHYKSSRHQRETSVAEITDVDAEQPSPEQVVIATETAAEVRRQVGRLTPDQQRVLRLRFWQDLSVAQTAAVMGRSVRAVERLRHRGIAGLRATMPNPRPVPPPREGPDRLAATRQAVFEVAQHVAEQERDTDERERGDRLARWQPTDHASTKQRCGTTHEAILPNDQLSGA